MDQLVITPRLSVGPLNFGESSDEVATKLGLPQNSFKFGAGDGVCAVWSSAPFSSCDFSEDRLTALTINHQLVNSVLLADVDLLRTPLDQVLAYLDQTNGGTDQIQGGSLCYEQLGLLLSQFEDVGARELVVTSDSITEVEPTRTIGLQGALDYYRAQKDANPAEDFFGRLP